MKFRAVDPCRRGGKPGAPPPRGSEFPEKNSSNCRRVTKSVEPTQARNSAWHSREGSRSKHSLYNGTPCCASTKVCELWLQENLTISPVCQISLGGDDRNEGLPDTDQGRKSHCNVRFQQKYFAGARTRGKAALKSLREQKKKRANKLDEPSLPLRGIWACKCCDGFRVRPRLGKLTVPSSRTKLSPSCAECMPCESRVAYPSP